MNGMPYAGGATELPTIPAAAPLPELLPPLLLVLLFMYLPRSATKIMITTTNNNNNKNDNNHLNSKKNFSLSLSIIENHLQCRSHKLRQTSGACVQICTFVQRAML